MASVPLADVFPVTDNESGPSTRKTNYVTFDTTDKSVSPLHVKLFRILSWMKKKKATGQKATGKETTSKEETGKEMQRLVMGPSHGQSKDLLNYDGLADFCLGISREHERDKGSGFVYTTKEGLEDQLGIAAKTLEHLDKAMEFLPRMKKLAKLRLDEGPLLDLLESLRTYTDDVEEMRTIIEEVALKLFIRGATHIKMVVEVYMDIGTKCTQIGEELEDGGYLHRFGSLTFLLNKVKGQEKTALVMSDLLGDCPTLREEVRKRTKLSRHQTRHLFREPTLLQALAKELSWAAGELQKMEQKVFYAPDQCPERLFLGSSSAAQKSSSFFSRLVTFGG